jgi:hypothetical protein
MRIQDHSRELISFNTDNKYTNTPAQYLLQTTEIFLEIRKKLLYIWDMLYNLCFIFHKMLFMS